jgi:hypothetical protein
MGRNKKLFAVLLGVSLIGLTFNSCATAGGGGTKTGIIQESPDIIVGTWSVGGQKFTFRPDKTGIQEFMGAIIDFTYEWDDTHSLYLLKIAGSPQYMKILDPKTAYLHGSYTFKPEMARLTMKKTK